ncbi:Phosphoribosylamine--glycine ligase [hydrothermal vent metagenome]|uniref:phosphoribosylamine--glycine ligase n=1 Tax=hydrothermal vent metagenome TaxID=652676 RepID=A0A3B1E611_9ZZZZ
MNILILGSGGREYSIGLALSKEDKKHNITFCPGNGATDQLGRNINIKDYNELALWAKQNLIDLTIVGPEAPLVDGVVDIFKANNLIIFGPSAKAAQLEGSKVYMKQILQKYNIPTAAFIQTQSQNEADAFIDAQTTLPIVVKADGICGGKGVIITPSKDEAKKAVKDMLSGKSFGDAGNKVIVEEFLNGYELSVFAICDGDHYIVLPAAQDHKRIGDGDSGPNTGGMGAYAPTPLVNDEIYKKIEQRVIKPTLDGMKKENAPFQGVLFMGVMIVNNEPIILEYNVRFGDPECEILIPLMRSDVSELFYKGATKQLHNFTLEMKDEYCVAVVMASKNYPYSNSIPAEIIVDEIHDEKLKENSHISYAGVTRENNTLMATGGRVLLCIGFGKDINTARNRAYDLCGQVHFAGKKIRTDIAYQALV